MAMAVTRRWRSWGRRGDIGAGCQPERRPCAAGHLVAPHRMLVGAIDPRVARRPAGTLRWETRVSASLRSRVPAGFGSPRASSYFSSSWARRSLLHLVASLLR